MQIKYRTGVSAHNFEVAITVFLKVPLIYAVPIDQFRVVRRNVVKLARGLPRVVRGSGRNISLEGEWMWRHTNHLLPV